MHYLLLSEVPSATCLAPLSMKLFNWNILILFSFFLLFFKQVEDSIEKIDPSIKEAAYHAWLGYYNSIHEIGRDKTMLADLANRFCHSIGMDKPPALFRKTALKMGLKGIPGIRIRK